jgi:hypothetical protein
LVESNSLCGQRIDVWRFDSLLTHEPEFLPTQVVGHNKDDIGAATGTLLCHQSIWESER